MSSDLPFTVGSTIHGKWNNRRYRIERKLGEGSNGQVFLVNCEHQPYALKIGFDPADLQAEVNMIVGVRASLGKEDDFLKDVDDFVSSGQTFPFYVMKYVKGVQASRYIRMKGINWIYPIGLKMLNQLHELHRKGWIFADLKPDNVLVTGFGDVELIDYGGVTLIGRSIRQFTEIFDRGYWNCGTRTADEAYDLFAFAVFCLHVAGARQSLMQSAALLPQNRGCDYLIDLVRTTPGCRNIAPFLEKAIRGKYARTSDAITDWRELALQPDSSRPTTLAFDWVKAAFIVTACLCGSTIYYLLQ